MAYGPAARRRGSRTPSSRAGERELREMAAAVREELRQEHAVLHSEYMEMSQEGEAATETQATLQRDLRIVQEEVGRESAEFSSRRAALTNEAAALNTARIHSLHEIEEEKQRCRTALAEEQASMAAQVAQARQQHAGAVAAIREAEADARRRLQEAEMFAQGANSEFAARSQGLQESQLALQRSSYEQQTVMANELQMALSEGRRALQQEEIVAVSTLTARLREEAAQADERRRQSESAAVASLTARLREEAAETERHRQTELDEARLSLAAEMRDKLHVHEQTAQARQEELRREVVAAVDQQRAEAQRQRDEWAEWEAWEQQKEDSGPHSEPRRHEGAGPSSDAAPPRYDGTNFYGFGEGPTQRPAQDSRDWGPSDRAAGRAGPPTSGPAGGGDVPSLHETVALLAKSVGDLAGMVQSNAANNQQLLSVLGDRASEERLKVTADKPVVTAAGAETLRDELRRFKIVMNEAKCHERSRWFRAARAVSKGRAAEVLDNFITSDMGGEERYGEALLRPADPTWNGLWERFEAKLKQAAGLDDASELHDAIREYSSVRLEANATPAQVEEFLDRYLKARTPMIKQGLLSSTDATLIAREIEDFKEKIRSSRVSEYLNDLPEFPRLVDTTDPGEFKNTIVGRIRQWLRPRRAAAGAGSAQAIGGKGSLLNMGNGEQIPEGIQKELQGVSAALLALDSKFRLGAARDPSDKGGGHAGPSGTGAAGVAACARCNGRHPECATCPNATATDEGFDVSQLAKSETRCDYRHRDAGFWCDGRGHLRQHHHRTDGADPRPPGKGKDFKGKGKGKNKKGGKLLNIDMNDTHTTDTNSTHAGASGGGDPPVQSAAARLLQLLTIGDADQTDSSSDSVLDFSIGHDDPVARHDRFPFEKNDRLCVLEIRSSMRKADVAGSLADAPWRNGQGSQPKARNTPRASNRVTPHFCIFQGDDRGTNGWSLEDGSRRGRWDTLLDSMLKCVMMDGQWNADVSCSLFVGADAVHVTGAVQSVLMRPIGNLGKGGRTRYAPATVHAWEEALWNNYGTNRPGLVWELDRNRAPNKQQRLLERLDEFLRDAPSDSVAIVLDYRNVDATYEELKAKGVDRQPHASTVYLLLGGAHGFDGKDDRNSGFFEAVVGVFAKRLGQHRVARVNLCEPGDTAKFTASKVAAFLSVEHSRGMLGRVVAGLRCSAEARQTYQPCAGSQRADERDSTATGAGCGLLTGPESGEDPKRVADGHDHDSLAGPESVQVPRRGADVRGHGSFAGLEGAAASTAACNVLETHDRGDTAAAPTIGGDDEASERAKDLQGQRDAHHQQGRSLGQQRVDDREAYVERLLEDVNRAVPSHTASEQTDSPRYDFAKIVWSSDEMDAAEAGNSLRRTTIMVREIKSDQDFELARKSLADRGLVCADRSADGQWAAFLFFSPETCRRGFRRWQQKRVGDMDAFVVAPGAWTNLPDGICESGNLPNHQGKGRNPDKDKAARNEGKAKGKGKAVGKTGSKNKDESNKDERGTKRAGEELTFEASHESTKVQRENQSWRSGLLCLDSKPGAGPSGERGDPWIRIQFRRWQHALHSTIGPALIGLLALVLVCFLCIGAQIPDAAASGAGGRLAVLGAQHGLGQALTQAAAGGYRRWRRRRGGKGSRDDSHLALKLNSGYNCRGYVWFGPARTDAVFDSGACRNAISKAYLEQLIKDGRTTHVVEYVVEIEPISCTGMMTAMAVEVKRMAVVRLTFKESGLSRSSSVQLGVVVIPGLSENLIIGKPTLDRLGFISDKDSIEVRAAGLRFPTILPAEHRVEDETLMAPAAHVLFETPAGQSRVQSTLMAFLGEAKKGDNWWIEAGPDLPEELQVIEGPLKMQDGQARVDFLVHAPHRAGPADGLVSIRPQTQRDLDVLAALARAEAQRGVAQDTLRSCYLEASATLATEAAASSTSTTAPSPPSSNGGQTATTGEQARQVARHDNLAGLEDSAAAQVARGGDSSVDGSRAPVDVQILAASYKTRGKKARQ